MFWTLFVIAGFLAFFVMSPYLTTMFLAGVFAVMFSPIYERFYLMSAGKNTVAALLTVLLLLLVVLIPLFYVGYLMSEEALSIYSALVRGVAVPPFLDHILNVLAGQLHAFAPTFDLRVSLLGYMEYGLRWVVENFDTFLARILSYAFQALLLLVGMFFSIETEKNFGSFSSSGVRLAMSMMKRCSKRLSAQFHRSLRGHLPERFCRAHLSE